MRSCRVCHIEKPLSDYALGRGTPKTRCKACDAVYLRAWYARNRDSQAQKARAHYIATRETRLAQERAARQADPERFRARDRERHVRRREQVLQRAAAWRAANPARHRVLMRRWYEANRERALAHSDLRRLRLTDAFVAAVDRRAIYERDCGRCGICGEHVEYDAMHLDHIQPIARGGLHCPENVQVAHASCNRRKHAKVAV